MISVLRKRLFTALELLLSACITLTVTLPFCPASGTFPSRDAGVFLYFGWRILHGEIPYLQIWDHKAPGIFYLNSLGLALTPGSTWGVWILEVVLFGLAVAIGYFLLKRLFGILPAALLAFLWPFTGYYLFVGGNLTTEYVLPFQFALLWLFYRAENRPRYGWYGFALGVVTALLFFIRQNAVAIPLAIGIYLLVNRLTRLEAHLWKDALPILAGGLLVTGLVIGYFAWHGALPDFWSQSILYNISYADEKPDADRLSALFSGLDQLANVGLAPLAIMGWGAGLSLLLFKKNRFAPELRPLLWMSVLALPLELWLVSLSGRPRLPYFMTLLPLFALFAGLLVWLIFDGLLRDIPYFASVALVVLMVLSTWSVFHNDYAELAANYSNDPETPPLITYIQQNTQPDDYVLMWGAETAYNFVSRRPSPVRYVYQYPLYNAYANQENVSEFLKDILVNQPRLIIMITGGSLSDIHFGYRDDQIGLLMDQVKARYVKSDEIGKWVVYTLQSP